MRPRQLFVNLGHHHVHAAVQEPRHARGHDGADDGSGDGLASTTVRAPGPRDVAEQAPGERSRRIRKRELAHGARGDVGGERAQRERDAQEVPRGAVNARAFVGAEQVGQERHGIAVAHGAGEPRPLQEPARDGEWRERDGDVNGAPPAQGSRRAVRLEYPDSQEAGARVPPGAEQIRRPDASRTARLRAAVARRRIHPPAPLRGAGVDALALVAPCIGLRRRGRERAGRAPRRRCDVVHLADETKALPRRVRGHAPSLPRHRQKRAEAVLLVVASSSGRFGLARGVLGVDELRNDGLVFGNSPSHTRVLLAPTRYFMTVWREESNSRRTPRPRTTPALATAQPHQKP